MDGGSCGHVWPMQWLQVLKRLPLEAFGPSFGEDKAWSALPGTKLLLSSALSLMSPVCDAGCWLRP